MVSVMNKEQQLNTYFCLSVAGGWQTMLSLTGEPIGPVFNKIQDLWAWQRNNLITLQENNN
jgi:hypothetical protein